MEKNEVEGKTKLHLAAEDGDWELCEKLIKKGHSVDSVDSIGRTPLHYASSGDVVEALVQAGAAKNAMDDDGNTPCHLAAIKGRPAIADLLVVFGALSFLKNRAGKTPGDYVDERYKSSFRKQEFQQSEWWGRKADGKIKGLF